MVSLSGTCLHYLNDLLHFSRISFFPAKAVGATGVPSWVSMNGTERLREEAPMLPPSLLAARLSRETEVSVLQLLGASLTSVCPAHCGLDHGSSAESDGPASSD